MPIQGQCEGCIPKPKELKQSTEFSELLHRDPDIPQDLDVTDIQWEAFCLWMAFSRRWLYKQLRFSLSHWAPQLLFMTKSLQQHQSLMTKYSSAHETLVLPQRGCIV